VGEGRGTELAAAPTLGAGVHVQHLFPGEIGDRRDTESGVLVDVLEIHADELARRVEPGEEDVEQRRIDVEVLGVRQLIGEVVEDEQVQPPQHGVGALQR